MNRFFRISTLVAFAGLMLGAMPTAEAAFSVGTQGFADLGSPSINNASLASATTFTFGTPLVTTTAETGSFMTTPSNGLTVTTSTLDLSNPTSFTMGSTAFGTFTASTITSLFASPQVRSFFILGTFVAGTNFGTPVTSAPASFTVSFTQTGGPSSAISDSSTLAVPPSVVPEPASLAMLGLGLAGVAGYTARRRRTR